MTPTTPPAPKAPVGRPGAAVRAVRGVWRARGARGAAPESIPAGPGPGPQVRSARPARSAPGARRAPESRRGRPRRSGRWTCRAPDGSPRPPPPRVGACPAGHDEDRGHRSRRPVRHRDAYLHPNAFLGRVTPAAQPDHRVSDLPRDRSPKRVRKHQSAGSPEPLTPWPVCELSVRSQRFMHLGYLHLREPNCKGGGPGSGARRHLAPGSRRIYPPVESQSGQVGSRSANAGRGDGAKGAGARLLVQGSLSRHWSVRI